MNYRRSKAGGATFFFTVVTNGRRPILCDGNNISLLRESFHYAIGRHPFVIDAIVIMPDHIHCIWTLPDGDNDFPVRWRLTKSFFTRHCEDRHRGRRTDSQISKGAQAVWQQRYWEHQIKDDNDYIRHVEYIHYNPVKHGLADSPNQWPHSSFHRFVEQNLYPVTWGSNLDIEFEEKIGKE